MKARVKFSKKPDFIPFFPGEACLAGSLDPANFISPILIAEMVDLRVLKNDLPHQVLVTRTMLFK
ncbi:MAG: hypothetical protein B7X86_10040 [Sphingobacteriales bacterium 17-39-43]|nr:MAG: hypothetical protein B7Y24_09980 [Sphingobacteriales bacterium 16-39-50]OZA24091.1 MAG: hypothetical protein B7X86_10040 [Sphingobacteriales bacterium 17-39-43]